MEKFNKLISSWKREKAQYELYAENPPNLGGGEDPEWVYASKAYLIGSMIEELEAVLAIENSVGD